MQEVTHIEVLQRMRNEWPLAKDEGPALDAAIARLREPPEAQAQAQGGGEVVATPAARWREAGEPDPHGRLYDCERAKLSGGDMSDDEVANAMFLDPSIVNLTIAKDRIRWLSRRLSAPPSAPVGGEDREIAEYDQFAAIVNALHGAGETMERAVVLARSVAAALAQQPAPSAPVGVPPAAVMIERDSLNGGIGRAGDWVVELSEGRYRVMGEHVAHGWNACRDAMLAAGAALAQQPAAVPALEVFRIAGGDTECEPSPTADRALEVLRDLRACYDEALAQQPASPLAAIRQSPGYAIEKARLEGYAEGRADALAEQPAAVDGEAVRKAIRKVRNIANEAGAHPTQGPRHANGMRRACNLIEAALAAQPGGGK